MLAYYYYYYYYYYSYFVIIIYTTSGYISYEEISIQFKKSIPHITQQEIRFLLSLFDPNSVGYITR